MEDRKFVNIYFGLNGKYISHETFPSAQKAYDNRDRLASYIETVEIISCTIKKSKKP